MQSYTNSSKPPKSGIKLTKKEIKSGQIDSNKLPKTKITATKVGAAPDKSGDGAKMMVKAGTTKTSYTPADVRTGHSEYGKESATKPTPKFVTDAQKQKKDIVMKNGKPFRAGFTTKTDTPAEMSTSNKVTPDVRKIKLSTKTSTNPQADNDEKREKISQLLGKSSKRKLPHVDYLEKVKKNKKTEAGHGR